MKMRWPQGEGKDKTLLLRTGQDNETAEVPRQKANGKRQSDRRQKALKANTARAGQDEHTADNDVINIEIHVTATVMGVVQGVGLIKINVYFALLLLIKNRLQQQIENLNVTQKYLTNFISSPLPSCVTGPLAKLEVFSSHNAKLSAATLLYCGYAPGFFV